MKSDSPANLILIQVVLLAASIAAFILIILHRNWHFTLSGLGVLVLVQGWLLYRSIRRRDQHLQTYWETLLEENFMSLPPEQNTKVPAWNHEVSRKIRDLIQKTRLESEQRNQLLRFVVGETGTGLMAYTREKGKVLFANPRALELLSIHEIDYIGHLKAGRPALLRFLEKLPPGKNHLLPVHSGNYRKTLFIEVSTVRIDAELVILLGIQDVSNELEKNESEAWMRLLRIIGHEINNSVSPIGSVIQTLQKKLEHQSIEHKEDVLQGLEIINSRTQRLRSFVQEYRSLLQPPPVKPEQIVLKNLIDNTFLLLKSELEEQDIRWVSHVSPLSLRMQADLKLMEQILINLVRNAMDAVKSSPKKRISLIAVKQEQICIQIRDTGCGISPDDLERVFIPFYTTKPEGSGIGLSFVQQSLLRHNASIQILSRKGKGSCCRIQIPFS